MAGAATESSSKAIRKHGSRLIHAVLYKYWLAEKAYARIKALKRLGVTNYVYDEQNTIKEIKRWNDEIIEPDHILKPKETIDGIIRPIIGNKEKGCLLLSPQKDNISFIICGPPGSGKPIS